MNACVLYQTTLLSHYLNVPHPYATSMRMGVPHPYATSIALMETWLCEDNECLCSLPNYTLISLPRQSRRGGGVGFYVLNSLVYAVKKSMTISNDIMETITIDIVQRFSHILITCMYRHPGSNVDSFNTQFDSLQVQLKTTET